jgi:hypothetical protein
VRVAGAVAWADHKAGGYLYYFYHTVK